MERANNSKTLLILASKLGYQTRGFAAAAEKLNVTVAFGTDRCHQLDDPWADHALPLHFENPLESAEEIARQWRHQPPDAILAIGDRPTAAAAYAAEALKLKGNPPESVEVCRNKLRQRETLRDAGVHVPGFTAFNLQDDLATVLRSVSFPCVVKPVALSASQGVIRANDEQEFRQAVARIRGLLENPEIQALRDPLLGSLIAERYIPGREIAIEGLLDGGHFRILVIFDKPDPLEGPYFEETIYVTPSRLTGEQQRELGDYAQRCVQALGLVTGPVHAEFRINESGPWALEIAPRPIGGLCSRALRFGADRISLEELLIRHALGMPGADEEREPEASGVMMIPVPRSGILERVEGIEEAEKIEGVTEIQITARLRDYVAAWPEGASYLGFIFARSASPEEVEHSLREAHGELRFHFSPRLPVEHPVTGKVPRGNA